MKKLGLFCIVMLTCGCLAACSNSNSSKENSSISSLKAENSSLKAKKHSSHKVKYHRQSSSQNSSGKADNSGSNSQAGAKGQQASNTQQSNANNIVRDKDGRIVYSDGTRGPIPSPYKEGTPEYDQWLMSTNESIRIANNEPALQLGPEPRATNGQ